MKRPSVAAIVPAFNEEATIADVVRPLVASELIDEVFVISDGSTDATKERAREVGAHTHELPRTGGKGEAMLHAVAHTDAEVLVFFDADLIGLTTEHVESLLLPVVNGGRWMNIGIRDRGTFFTWLSHHLPLISGERAMRRSVFEGVPAEYMRGFMVETALNYYCRVHRLRYGGINLPGLTIRRKYEKVPWPRAVVQYICMFWQIVQAMLIVRLARFFRKF
jgi:glycosyltransferase involved in cell wall biosynthesis